jgi:hypothetical protein
LIEKKVMSDGSTSNREEGAFSNEDGFITIMVLPSGAISVSPAETRMVFIRARRVGNPPYEEGLVGYSMRRPGQFIAEEV